MLWIGKIGLNSRRETVNRKTSIIRFLSFGGLSLLLLPVLYSCSIDSGLATSEPTPFGGFTAATSGILSGYHHPRFAVLWESENGSVTPWDLGNATPDTVPGHGDSATSLSVILYNLPALNVSNSDSGYVVGKLWLYDDTSGSASLALTTPADYQQTLNGIASAQQQLNSAMSALTASAQFTSAPVGVSDSFQVSGGQLYLLSAPPPSGHPILNTSHGVVWDWRTLLRARFKVLYQPNKWEAFFNPSGGFSAGNFQLSPAGSDTFVSSCQLARYQGSGTAYEQALEAATVDEAWLDSLRDAAKNEIDGIWQESAPFPAHQRFLGRSTGDFIVYFSNRAALNVLDSAENASAFFFAGKDELNVGFNWVNCDTVGNCNVLQNAEEPVIQLADRTTPMFNFPQIQPSPLVSSAQIDSSTLSSESDASSSQYDGKYACACDTVNSFIETFGYRTNVDMEMQFLNYGFLKFQAVDQRTYLCDDTAGGLSLSILARFGDSTYTAYSSSLMDTTSYKLNVTIQDNIKNTTQHFYFPKIRPLSISEETQFGDTVNP